MHALLRQPVRPIGSLLLRHQRCLATAASVSDAATASSTAASSSSSPAAKAKATIIPVSNVEAQWNHMSVEEKAVVHEQLEEVMKKDWKTLTLDEKKAAYFVSFGPHGPRTPATRPGDNIKIFAAVMALLGVAGLIQFGIDQTKNAPPPRTRTKEWEEATNQRALEQKINPISGISSEGYKGKGFVQE